MRDPHELTNLIIILKNEMIKKRHEEKEMNHFSKSNSLSILCMTYIEGQENSS
jgi:hypothetical protein